MAGPATEARDRLITVVNTTFAPEGWVALADRISDSLGHKGTKIGVTVERLNPSPGRYIVQEIELSVRFYGYYEKKVDPTQRVDPTRVEGYAYRFQQAVENDDAAGTDKVWYYNVAGIEFPDDPTGNKTRFVARVIAYGNNPALIETTG